MNDNQRQDIKSVTASREWQSVVEVLKEEIERMLDVRTIDLDNDIVSQVFARQTAVDALNKFLIKVELVGKKELKLKPKNFK